MKLLDLINILHETDSWYWKFDQAGLDRLKPFEDEIAKDGFYAYKYATEKLLARFPKGEESIARYPEYKKKYEKIFNVKLPTPPKLPRRPRMRIQKATHEKVFWPEQVRDLVGEQEPWGDTILLKKLPKGTIKLYDVYSDPKNSGASEGYNEHPELTISRDEFEKGLIPFTGSFGKFMDAWLQRSDQQKH